MGKKEKNNHFVDKVRLTIEERATILGILRPQAHYTLVMDGYNATDEQKHEFMDKIGIPRETNHSWYLMIDDFMYDVVKKNIKKGIKKYFRELDERNNTGWRNWK